MDIGEASRELHSWVDHFENICAELFSQTAGKALQQGIVLAVLAKYDDLAWPAARAIVAAKAIERLVAGDEAVAVAADFMDKAVECDVRILEPSVKADDADRTMTIYAGEAYTDAAALLLRVV